MEEAQVKKLKDVFEAVISKEWSDFSDAVDRTEIDTIRDNLLSEIQKRVEKVSQHPEGCPDIQLITKNVINENKIKRMFDRYAKLMEEQNLFPVPLELFRVKTGHFPTSPYKRFLSIVKKGIHIGSRVIHAADKKIYEVVKISEQCVLIIKPESENPIFKKSSKCRRVMVDSCTPIEEVIKNVNCEHSKVNTA